MIRILIIVIEILFSALCGIAADLSVPDIYSDNMVFQADEPFFLTGKTYPKEKVLVKIQNRVKKTRADVNGNWEVQFSKFNEGSIGSIFIESKEEKIEIENVLVADLWLCSGQSNMARTAGLTDVTIDSKQEEIRFFSVTGINGISNNVVKEIKGKWEICNSDNYKECSAVGLSFAIHLSNTTHKPVGLFINAVGGSPIESWIQLDILKKKGYNKNTLKEREEWENNREIYQKEYNSKLMEWENTCQKLKEEGIKLSGKPWPPFALRENWNIGCLYNSLVYPLRNVTFKGVLWYQGESNDNRPFIYRYQLADMIKNWRTTFENNKIPFYIVQLPEYNTTADWATLRESQAKVTNLKNVHIIVTLGLGDLTNIHPYKKMEVGHRIAMQVLKNEYKSKLL